jgi:hypothetical protein
VKIGAAAERRILLALAVFAMLWAIVRAHVQAVTIDEAVTYLNFVLPVEPTYFSAHANNHVLNSMLARLFTRIFGVSALTLRAGALVGAALFISASYLISILIDQGLLLRAAVFICLVFNPLVFDFLVAARGYGLASGFLLWAICIVAYTKRPQIPAIVSTQAACVWASLCIALSFVSNFSFAFVDAASIVLLYAWASEGASTGTRARLAAACFLPGLLVAGAIAGPILLQWDRAELNYGADSLVETLKSLYDASFYELNPWLRDLIFIDIPGMILPIFGILVAWRAVLIWMNRQSLRNAAGRWSLRFATTPLAAVAAAFIMHWLMFHFARIPLPKDRTAIYAVFLNTLFLGGMAAVPISTRTGEISRRGLTILMVVLGSYFLLCVRMHYFKEWKWDADSDKVYSALASYNHECGLKDIAVNWRFARSLNFYRTVSGRETIPEFPRSLDYPPGKRAYVVYEPEDRDFLANRSLKTVYQAPSGAIIALNPAVAPPPGENACPIQPPDHNK